MTELYAASAGLMAPFSLCFQLTYPPNGLEAIKNPARGGAWVVCGHEGNDFRQESRSFPLLLNPLENLVRYIHKQLICRHHLWRP